MLSEKQKQSRACGFVALCLLVSLSLVEVVESAKLGCFQDGSGPFGDPSRDLTGLTFDDNSNTPGRCVSYCASQGYAYAGVQFGVQCWCGNNFGQVGGTWFSVNGGSGAVRGGNWNDRLSSDQYVTDMDTCAARCKSNPSCMSAMLQTSGPGCVLFPYTCSQTGTNCPLWASYAWVGYWQKGANPASLPQCNMPCAGDSSQTCGAGGINQVYSTADSLAPPKHLGCFADANSPRDLPALMVGDQNSYMTPQLCAFLCRPKYQYSGVQYMFQCWCGNRYGSLGASTNCNTACSGNSSLTCGGGYASNVYQLF